MRTTPRAQHLGSAIRHREEGARFILYLAAEIGCGYSFLKPRKPHTCDFNKVAKAVEFFGGRLVIDWHDA
jgi:hypothetical protein